MEKQVTVELDFEVEEVAELFCELGGFYMGHFFNAVGANLKGSMSWLQANLKESKKGGILTPEGLAVMELIGKYAENDHIELT